MRRSLHETGLATFDSDSETETEKEAKKKKADEEKEEAKIILLRSAKAVFDLPQSAFEYLAAKKKKMHAQPVTVESALDRLRPLFPELFKRFFTDDGVVIMNAVFTKDDMEKLTYFIVPQRDFKRMPVPSKKSIDDHDDFWQYFPGRTWFQYQCGFVTYYAVCVDFNYCMNRPSKCLNAPQLLDLQLIDPILDPFSGADLQCARNRHEPIIDFRPAPPQFQIYAPGCSFIHALVDEDQLALLRDHLRLEAVATAMRLIFNTAPARQVAILDRFGL